MRKQDTLTFKQNKKNPANLFSLIHAANVISVLINVLNVSIFAPVLFNNTSHAGYAQ